MQLVLVVDWGGVLRVGSGELEGASHEVLGASPDDTDTSEAFFPSATRPSFRSSLDVAILACDCSFFLHFKVKDRP